MVGVGGDSCHSQSSLTLPGVVDCKFPAHLVHSSELQAHPVLTCWSMQQTFVIMGGGKWPITLDGKSVERKEMLMISMLR
jgi:hypothetical protein